VKAESEEKREVIYNLIAFLDLLDLKQVIRRCLFWEEGLELVEKASFTKFCERREGPFLCGAAITFNLI
jgi:hypothetical protein